MPTLMSQIIAAIPRGGRSIYPHSRRLVFSAAAFRRLVLELDDLPLQSESPRGFRQRWPRIFGMQWRVDARQVVPFTFERMNDKGCAKAGFLGRVNDELEGIEG